PRSAPLRPRRLGRPHQDERRRRNSIHAPLLPVRAAAAPRGDRPRSRTCHGRTARDAHGGRAVNPRAELAAAPRVPLRYLVEFNPRPRPTSDESCYLPMEAISEFGGIDTSRTRPTSE